MIYVNCNLCGRDDWQLRFPATVGNSHRPDVDLFRCTCAGYGDHLQIVECRHCGHIYANPRWVGEALIDAYIAVEDDMYVAEQAARRRTFEKHLRTLERVVGPGNGRRILDVGAYIGIFVEVATAAGWRAVGVEPSHWAVDLAQQQGLAVIQGTLDSPALQGQEFDVITMWDVIEHFDNPTAELEKAYRLLKPEGTIAIHTMDIESLTAKLLGRRWPWLMDMHIHYFTRQTLAHFLEKAGFEVIWSGAQGRYLSLGYLVTRVAGFSNTLARIAGGLVGRAGVKEVTVPVNFGDLFTVYAWKPNHQSRGR